jgi:hypothetical protein
MIGSGPGFFGGLFVMPQPYTVPADGGFMSPSYAVLKNRPECAIRIAMIASASAELEDGLAGLIAMASGAITSYSKEGPVTSFGSIPNQVVRAALEAVVSMPVRLDITRAILELCVSAELCEEFDLIAKSIRRAANMRNEVVHCVWAAHAAGPNDLLKITGPGECVRYTPKDFDAIIDRILEEYGKLIAFRVKCAEERSRRSPPARA